MLYHGVFFTLKIFNNVILLFAVATFSIIYMVIVFMIIHGSQSTRVGFTLLERKHLTHNLQRVFALGGRGYSLIQAI